MKTYLNENEWKFKTGNQQINSRAEQTIRFLHWDLNIAQTNSNGHTICNTEVSVNAQTELLVTEELIRLCMLHDIPESRAAELIHVLNHCTPLNIHKYEWRRTQKKKTTVDWKVVVFFPAPTWKLHDSVLTKKRKKQKIASHFQCIDNCLSLLLLFGNLAQLHLSFDLFAFICYIIMNFMNSNRMNACKCVQIS